ncbi:MAG TPA: YrzE family protein [Candidatus Caenarcaniphilales bacterium]|nr:YrzE family protein [Candidatus Caenarcaniphilales bacterium]
MQRERETVRRETIVRPESRRDMDVETAAAGAVARDPLTWGPIWAGVLTAFGVFFLLSLIALAAGLQAVDLGGGGGQGGGDVPVDVIASVVTGLFLVVAFFAGGFVSAWSAGLVDQGRGILHGFLVWALFIILLLVFAAAGVGSVFGAAGELFSGQFAAGATPDVNVNPDQLLESFQDAAWQTLFAIVLAMSAAVLGGFVGTLDAVSRRWSDYTERFRR